MTPVTTTTEYTTSNGSVTITENHQDATHPFTVAVNGGTPLPLTAQEVSDLRAALV